MIELMFLTHIEHKSCSNDVIMNKFIWQTLDKLQSKLSCMLSFSPEGFRFLSPALLCTLFSETFATGGLLISSVSPSTNSSSTKMKLSRS